MCFGFGFIYIIVNKYIFTKACFSWTIKQLQYIFRDSNNERQILTRNCNKSNRNDSVQS